MFRGVDEPPLCNAEASGYREWAAREVEKARIREEIIAREVARRRLVEAEVRREVMAGLGLPFGDQPCSFPPPLQQRFPETAAEIDPKPEARKDRIIFLPKPQPQPQPDVSGTKRKAVTPPDLPESNKKPREWKCTLCQVIAPNNVIFNQHLEGKRHKRREARLEAADKLSELHEKTSIHKPAMAKSAIDSNEHDFVQRMKDQEENRAEEETSLQKSQCADEETVEEAKKRKFKCWCETCKIGAHSVKVMNTHMKGKKHMARLKQLGLNEADDVKGKATTLEGVNLPPHCIPDSSTVCL